MNQINKSSYYLIVQRMNDYKFTNKIEEPTDIKSIQKIVNCLVGNISVFLYDAYNRSKDMTDELGKFDKDINIDKLYIIKKVKYTTIKAIQTNTKHFEFFLTNLIVYTEATLPKVLVYDDTVCQKRALFSMYKLSNFMNDYPKENQRKIEAGQEYEKFIADKYIQNGYDVIYQGINKNKKDGGIDLIAKNEDKIVLIQCKNWKTAGYRQINSKDIRSFFGDCFKYILENQLLYNKMAFHFIVADKDSMRDSAKYYLQDNTFIKYKCIPFVLE